jgi:two-component system NtrC family sensor kinase
LARVTSEEGKGTTISLYLPRSRAEPAPALPDAAERRAAGTILLVEDNHSVGELAEVLLQDLGCTVKRAETAHHALQILGDGQGIDLVFTDVVMEGQVSGLDLAQTVRNRCPTMPVLLTTGYSAAAMDALAKGFPILHKPYRPDDLERAVSNMLSARKRA